jgi:hypothetical protein
MHRSKYLMYILCWFLINCWRLKSCGIWLTFWSSSSEMSVTNYQSTQRCIPETLNLHKNAVRTSSRKIIVIIMIMVTTTTPVILVSNELTTEESSFDAWQGQETFPLESLQTGPGVHTVSCLMNAGGFPSRTKQEVCAADHLPPSSVEVKNHCTSTSTPPMRSRHAQDTFTCCCCCCC